MDVVQDLAEQEIALASQSPVHAMRGSLVIASRRDSVDVKRRTSGKVAPEAHKAGATEVSCPATERRSWIVCDAPSRHQRVVRSAREVAAELWGSTSCDPLRVPGPSPRLANMLHNISAHVAPRLVGERRRALDC